MDFKHGGQTSEEFYFDQVVGIKGSTSKKEKVFSHRYSHTDATIMEKNNNTVFS